jgi:aromatic-L-amino-acid/L-tryptophan decarboxylase
VSAPPGGLPLEPAADEMREMGEAVTEALIAWIGGLADAPAENTGGALDVARRVAARPPATGSADFKPLLDEALEAARHTFEFSGPGYLAYIPGGGLFTAALAEYLAHGLNRYAGLWQASPAVVQLEENVTRWLCDVFDFPAASQGVLTSGGSMANLSAVVTARHAKLGADFLDGTYYVTDQAHGSNTKAATIAGFAERNLRLVPTDDQLRMDVDALARMVAEDRAAGARPFLVVGAAGTTNTGAIDPLGAIADVAAHEGLWFHIDAAYGGFFQLTGRGREGFRGAERADSITLDPHKGLFLPYGTGGLIVRDRDAMRDAHFEGAAYLQDLPPAGDLPNYNELTPELSRDVRGLRVWWPLVLHGVDAFRAALDEKLDLTTRIHSALQDDPNLELGWDPQLTVVTFRARGGDEGRSRALLERINASKRVFLSSTLIRGEYWLRVCIVSHRTHADRIDECAEIVRSAAATVAA